MNKGREFWLGWRRDEKMKWTEKLGVEETNEWCWREERGEKVG